MQIIRYANRLEIRNPGFSLKSPEHLGEPGSTPRNPKIATLLHETRFAETKGSGVRVMREMAAQAGLAPPLFESDRGQDLFVARFLFHHFLGEDDLRWLARFKELNLGDADARAIVVARENGAIDNATYREINRVDTLLASQALRRLRDAGLLEQKGRGSATWYRPTPRLLDGSPGLSPRPGALSSNRSGLSSKPQGLTSDPAALASNPQAQADGDAERLALIASLPEELAQAVHRLGRRSLPAAMRQVVVALCRWRDWRADELALLLGRQAETMRQDYLRPLMRDGRIAMTRPDKPNDPQQAYRAVEGSPS